MMFRYKQQILHMYLHYFDRKLLSEDLLEKETSFEIIKKVRQDEYDLVKLIFPTLDYVHDLIVPPSLRHNNTYNLSKEDKLRAFHLMISERTRVYQDMMQIYPIGKATESKINMKKQIEALHWYKELINQHII